MKRLLLVVFCLFVLSTVLIAQNPASKEAPLFPISQDGKWGYMDQTGKPVIKPRFDYAYDFSDGFGRIKIGKKYWFVNRSGILVGNVGFDAAGNFSDGLAKVSINGRWGFINSTGRLVIPARFHDWLNGKIGYIDRTGKFIWGPTE